MKQKCLFFFLFVLCIYTKPCAQSVLTAPSNMPREGDSICRRQVSYFDPGESGVHVIWDLRDIHFEELSQRLWFCRDSDSTSFYEMSPRLVRKYQCRNDSLLLSGYETALQSMYYEIPLTIYAFPVVYGDHFTQPFYGQGTYCKKQILEQHGTIEVEADASGTIYLNDADTLYNVLRLHYITTSSISQHHSGDSVSAENENRKQRIEEHYLWFAHGYRYPVFETSTITIYHDLTPVSCQQTAYCTMPSDQLLLEDSINREILINDSLDRANAVPIIHYRVSVSGNTISIAYTLDADATINAIVCDHMGMAYRRTTTTDSSGATGILRLDGNGLKSGIYVLYLNVNGQIYNEKVEL